MPDLPLYDGAKHFNNQKGANSGLAFYKFVDLWDTDDGKYGLGTRKKDWVVKFARKHGKLDELKRATARMVELAAHSVREGTKNIPVEYVTTSRFVTGLGYEHGIENGFVWHHTLGVPYLPSSGIKGMIRAYADHWEGIADQQAQSRIERIIELFGNYGPPAKNDKRSDVKNSHRTLRMGRLIVFDALPVEPVQCIAEVMTPHDGGWRAKGPERKDGVILSPGDWHAPNPIPFLAVDEKQKFLFALGLGRGGTQADLDDGYRLLEEALSWIGAGAKTAGGYGRFMQRDALAALEQSDKEREDKMEQAQVEAAAAAHAAWEPKVGEILRQTTEDRPGKELVEVLEIDDSSEIFVKHRNATEGFWVEKDECEFHAASWDLA